MRNVDFSNDSVEFRGIWWLPESDQEQVAGIVTCSHESGIQLELIGSLSKFRPTTTEDEARKGIQAFAITLDAEFPIIHGLTTTGEKCTLYLNSQSNLHMPLSGFKSEVYYASFMFVGAHFDRPDDIKFSCFDICFSGVNEWINKSPWEYSITHDYKNDTTFHEAKISQDEAIAIPISDSDLTISFHRPATIEYDRYSSLSWAKNYIVELKCLEARNLEWFRWSEYDTQNLLTLLIGEPLYRKSITAYGKEYINKLGKTTVDPIKVYFQRTKTKNFREVKVHEVLVPFNKIDAKLSPIFSKWFTLAPRLRNTYNLYFGALYNDYIYPEALFLTLMQAIETYHRTLGDGLFVEKSEYKKYKTAIIAAFPDDMPQELKDSLASRIGYGNEHSLSMRVTNIFDGLGEKLSSLVTRNIELFTRRIVATRNYHTHYDERSERNSIERDDLFYANYRLRLLINILLFKEIGVDEDTIHSALTDHIGRFLVRYQKDVGQQER